MRILFIIIQALFILTGCTAVQDGRGRNIQNEAADQRDAKPIHVKNTAPETAENPGRTDIAKHLVEVTEKSPAFQMPPRLYSEDTPLSESMWMTI